MPKAAPGGREYLLEFHRQGSYVRVAAIDPVSGTEAVLVGAASASKEELSRLAVQKLQYVMERKFGAPGVPPKGKPTKKPPPSGTMV